MNVTAHLASYFWGITCVVLLTYLRKECDRAFQLLKESFLDFSWAYRIYLSSSKYKISRKIRFISRSIFYFSSSRTWFHYLRMTPLRRLAEVEPVFFDRVHRPLYDRRYSSFQRVDMMMAHYTLLNSQLATPLFVSLTEGSGLFFGLSRGKSGRHYQVVLRRQAQFEREGCLSLQLVQENKVLLTLSFSFTSQEKRHCIKIGGIQGTRDCGGAIRVATKDFYGIQPRLLLIKIVRILSERFCVDKISAINNRDHAYQALRYKRKTLIKSDYNALWLISGGSKQTDGNYNIPLKENTIRIEDRPSHKRAEYRYRYAMLNELEQEILLCLKPSTDICSIGKT